MRPMNLNGWIPSDIENTDKCFASSALRSIQTPSEKIIPEYTPISDQGSLGSCVANATVDALEMLQGLKNPDKVQSLSRLFVYYNARHLEDKMITDRGTYIRNAFRSLQDIGVCLESEWPYVEAKVNRQPPILSFKTALGNKINDYYAITSIGSERIKDIELAITNNHPVVFGLRIANSFFDANSSTILEPTSTVGGHAMIITGYKKDAFYVRNSWGKSWGDSTGHCWIGKSYIGGPLCSDLWVPTVEGLYVG